MVIGPLSAAATDAPGVPLIAAESVLPVATDFQAQTDVDELKRDGGTHLPVGVVHHTFEPRGKRGRPKGSVDKKKRKSNRNSKQKAAVNDSKRLPEPLERASPKLQPEASFPLQQTSQHEAMCTVSSRAATPMWTSMPYSGEDGGCARAGCLLGGPVLFAQL